MRVRRGQTFEVKLEGHAVHTSWTLGRLPAGIVLIGERDEPQSPASPDRVGGRGGQTFTLRAEREGDYQLIFNLGAPWEPHPYLVRTVPLTVIQGLPDRELA